MVQKICTVQVLATHNVEFPNYYPQPGHVEHDVADIWESVKQAILHAQQKLQSSVGSFQIVAIGITNQRETVCFGIRLLENPFIELWFGKIEEQQIVVRNSRIWVWNQWSNKKQDWFWIRIFQEPKVEWLLKNVPDAEHKARNGNILFGTIDTWLAWKLCGAHVTDPSNASRTLLFNIHTMDWDDELLQMLSVPRNCLPTIVDNSQIVGHTSGIGFFLPDGIPVAGLAGDQQSAFLDKFLLYRRFCQMYLWNRCFCFNEYRSKSHSKYQLSLTTVGWRLNGNTTYALEGECFYCGSCSTMAS